MNLLSRFDFGNEVTIDPPPGDWQSPPLVRKVVGVHFTESKVSYDLQGEDGTIPMVDSCDVVPVPK